MTVFYRSSEVDTRSGDWDFRSRSVAGPVDIPHENRDKEADDPENLQSKQRSFTFNFAISS